MNSPVSICDATFRYAESLDAFRLGPISLELHPGQVYGWRGHNGSGKSTLASILAGTRSLSSGSLSSLPKRRLYFQQNIAANIFPDLTVGEHLSLCNGTTRTADIISLFPTLREHLASYPDSLSGGQLQRLAFSLALTRDFDMYLFDEVTNHLDQKTSTLVGETMRRIAGDSRQPIVVFISHDERFLHEYADRIDTFEEGRIVPAIQ